MKPTHFLVTMLMLMSIELVHVVPRGYVHHLQVLQGCGFDFTLTHLFVAYVESKYQLEALC